VNIYWLKRDLRLLDNKALFESHQNQCLTLFIFEPSISFNYDFDIRHWRFIYESIHEMREKGLNAHLLYGEAIEIFKVLKEKYNELIIYSHIETGNVLSYDRDLLLKDYFKSINSSWLEYPTNGVLRGLKKRDGWDAHWIKYVKSEQVPAFNQFNNSLIDQEITDKFELPQELLKQLQDSDNQMLKGSETFAHVLLDEFLEQKVAGYWGALSYPDKSRYHCSLISAYISWGNISIRQIYQKSEQAKLHKSSIASLNQFMARLKWHCHFIQKLELQPSIEFKNLSSSFDNIRQKNNKKYLKAWKSGMTGYPLIDAAMRCVVETGYLNFRLRSTVVSFLTHLLWQPWQSGVGFLARNFLDYEPGIHFSQFQMQAGTTGINMIRIYNPIKQSREKDKAGIFIKKWVPELANIPSELIHEPWKLTEMDQMLYEMKIGKDYPKPIVDFDTAYKFAQEKLWSTKNSESNKRNAKKILKRHARRNRKEI